MHGNWYNITISWAKAQRQASLIITIQPDIIFYKLPVQTTQLINTF